jgi:hypothetical protein
MQTSMQGPYVGTGGSTNDQDASIEMISKRTLTNSTQKPNVSAMQLLKALIPAAVMIMAVFWINSSHIYGLFHHQGAYVKRAHVALADFDGGDFGEALRTAAMLNNGSYGHPTYLNIDSTTSSPEQIRHDVFKGKYWAAIVVQPGASARFEEAVSGSASSYNASNVYTYYLMPARYYTLYAAGIQSTVITTASTAAGVYSGRYIAPRIARGRFGNTTVAAIALAVPAQAVSANATSQSFADMDDKAFVNTLGAVFPVLMQFFFIMAWNGICNGMHLYAAYDLRTHILARFFCGLIWPFFSSLCSAGWTFAFRGSYNMTTRMFFAYWAVTWVYSMISFDLLDLITGFVPMAFVPFFLLTWIVFSVGAALGAPTILNNWYRINYFFPSLHWYQTFITIISEGGVNRLYYTLPILAAWCVLLKILSPLATKHRVNKAKQVFRYYNEKDALDAPH